MMKKKLALVFALGSFALFQGVKAEKVKKDNEISVEGLKSRVRGYNKEDAEKFRPVLNDIYYLIQDIDLSPKNVKVKDTKQVTGEDRSAQDLNRRLNAFKQGNKKDEYRTVLDLIKKRLDDYKTE